MEDERLRGPTGVTGPHILPGAAGASGPTGLLVPDGGVRDPSTGKTSPTIPLDVCLSTVVEGYIFGDLDSMAYEIKMKEMGAVCYPMVMAVIAGCELLGGMTGGTKNDEVNFYWTHWLSKVRHQYGRLGDLAQDLMRSGLMHIYLTKPGIGVRRDLPEQHLRMVEGVRVFNCVSLAEDFRRSYEEHTKAGIEANRGAAQDWLDRRMRVGVVNSTHVLGGRAATAFAPFSGAVIGPGTAVATGASGAGPLPWPPEADAR